MNTPLERILTGCLFKRKCFITFYKYITMQEQTSSEKYPEGRRQSFNRLLAIPKAIFQTLSVDGRLGIYEKRVTLWSPSCDAL